MGVFDGDTAGVPVGESDIVADGVAEAPPAVPDGDSVRVGEVVADAPPETVAVAVPGGGLVDGEFVIVGLLDGDLEPDVRETLQVSRRTRLPSDTSKRPETTGSTRRA